jgi:hypothetical protein
MQIVRLCGFAAGLGDRSAVVIPELDALVELAAWVSSPGCSWANAMRSRVATGNGVSLRRAAAGAAAVDVVLARCYVRQGSSAERWHRALRRCRGRITDRDRLGSRRGAGSIRSG